MTKRRYPRSVAKFIREEKGRIRKGTANHDERVRQIGVLYERFVHHAKS